MYFLATTLYTWARQLHSESTRLLFSFLFRGHIKLQIPSLHTERAATRETVEQETVGGFSVIQKTSVKGYHPNMIWAGKANGQTSPLCGLPFLLPRWLRACFHILTPNANFPSRNLQLEPCQLSRARIHPRVHGQELFFFFFHDCTNMKLWKKIIWNHLKMATHCHFSYQRLLAVREAIIQYLKSSYWAQKRNSTETAGFDTAFCKTWRDVCRFFFFSFSQTKGR